MRKTFILLIGIAVAVSTFAQETQREKKTPQERADLITANLQKNLELDEGQSAAVLEANLVAAEAIDALRAQANAGERDRAARKQMAQEARSINNRRMASIEEVLSEDQKVILSELMADYRKKSKTRSERRRTNFWGSLATD